VLEEELLVPAANEQIHDCRVAVINRFGEFSHRYQYFRTKADELFAQAEIRPADREGLEGLEIFSAVTAEMNRAAVAEREAFFLSAAMVDAYFSLLEHRLILLRAFTGKPMAPGDFEKLLGANWEGKMATVLDLNSKGKEGKSLLGQLRRIKERIRNPFAHGGVENDRGSIYVQLPGFGAVPGNFSRAKYSVRFNFRPIMPEDHTAMCDVFDRLDEMLEAGDLALPHRLLDSSVDPMFDPETLVEYATAIKGGNEKVEEWIDVWSREWERHQNADY
jgi:hypothetical protein